MSCLFSPGSAGGGRMEFMKSLQKIPVRILVTGSRGKSSIVRLLSAALSGAGLSVMGRITGVLPRELNGKEECLILRSGPGSVEEMRWWLRTLPPGLDAVVMENSAVDPELQPLAWNWLHPGCTVLTNVRPDHEEVWGRGEEMASLALCSAIGGGPVVLPSSVAEKPFVSEILCGQGCNLNPCPDGATFREGHLSIVKETCRLFGFEAEKCADFAAALPPDIADFKVFREGEGCLASAFSANDPESTESLFLSVGWNREETTVLYNSRKDRIGRLRSFSSWLSAFPWKRVVITGNRPFPLPGRSEYVSFPSPESMKQFIRAEGKVFGCGNVAGAPLEYLLHSPEEEALV